MTVARLPSRTRRPLQADVVAFDRHGRAVLLVEARPDGGCNGAMTAPRQLALRLRAAEPTIPFGMSADLAEMRIFGWDGRALSHLSTLRTEPILSAYDPEFGRKRIFKEYFITLIEGWLRDVAYGWKSERPPELDALESIHLAERLKGGTTSPGVMIGGTPVP